jgi:hypothetical protein
MSSEEVGSAGMLKIHQILWPTDLNAQELTLICFKRLFGDSWQDYCREQASRVGTAHHFFCIASLIDLALIGHPPIAISVKSGHSKDIPPSDRLMPNYHRAYIPGSTIFLTWVTYQRALLFNDPHNITLLRQATQQTI